MCLFLLCHPAALYSIHHLLIVPSVFSSQLAPAPDAAQVSPYWQLRPHRRECMGSLAPRCQEWVSKSGPQKQLFGERSKERESPLLLLPLCLPEAIIFFLDWGFICMYLYFKVICCGKMSMITPQWGALLFANVSVSHDSESLVSHSSSWPFTPLLQTLLELIAEEWICSLGNRYTLLEASAWDALSQDSHGKLHPNPSLFVLAQTETHRGLVGPLSSICWLSASMVTLVDQNNELFPGVLWRKFALRFAF